MAQYRNMQDPDLAEMESAVASIALTELEYVEARAMIGPWS